jgi:hypothetical protein
MKKETDATIDAAIDSSVAWGFLKVTTGGNYELTDCGRRLSTLAEGSKEWLVMAAQMILDSTTGPAIKRFGLNAADLELERYFRARGSTDDEINKRLPIYREAVEILKAAEVDINANWPQNFYLE